MSKAYLHRLHISDRKWALLNTDGWAFRSWGHRRWYYRRRESGEFIANNPLGICTGRRGYYVGYPLIEQRDVTGRLKLGHAPLASFTGPFKTIDDAIACWTVTTGVK